MACRPLPLFCASPQPRRMPSYYILTGVREMKRKYKLTPCVSAAQEIWGVLAVGQVKSSGSPTIPMLSILVL